MPITKKVISVGTCKAVPRPIVNWKQDYRQFVAILFRGSEMAQLAPGVADTIGQCVAQLINSSKTELGFWNGLYDAFPGWDVQRDHPAFLVFLTRFFRMEFDIAYDKTQRLTLDRIPQDTQELKKREIRKELATMHLIRKEPTCCISFDPASQLASFDKLIDVPCSLEVHPEKVSLSALANWYGRTPICPLCRAPFENPDTGENKAKTILLESGFLMDFKELNKLLKADDSDAIKLLLDKSPNARHRFSNGDTLYLMAIRYRSESVIALIHQHFPDQIFDRGHAGKNAFGLALHTGNFEFAALWLGIAATIKTDAATKFFSDYDRKYGSPLHHALVHVKAHPEFAYQILDLIPDGDPSLKVFHCSEYPQMPSPFMLLTKHDPSNIDLAKKIIARTDLSKVMAHRPSQERLIPYLVWMPILTHYGHDTEFVKTVFMSGKFLDRADLFLLERVLGQVRKLKKKFKEGTSEHTYYSEFKRALKTQISIQTEA